MQPLEAPLALRYWPEFTERKPNGKGSRNGKKWCGRLTRIGERVLVFDTETTADEAQSLRFGFFRVYVNEACEREGLFIADDLETHDPEGFETARAFAERYELEFLTRAKFVETVFYPEAKGLGALVVGFNLPFDVSRIAVRCAAGRGRYRDCFSFKLSESLFRPWIRIKPLNAHSSRIRFLKAKRSKFRESKPFDGRFLDLHTLCYALSQESHSLRSAGEAFSADTLKEQAPGQGDDEYRHGGALTPDYLQYARQDVAATYSLYLALSDAYSRFPFATSEPEEQQIVNGDDDTPITGLYSPASIAKAMFRKMRLKPTLLPPQYLGYAMSAFFGPRVEVRIRNKEVPATLLDFTSQYPAVFTLLDLWRAVIAKRVEAEEDTERVRELLARTAADPETLFQTETWKELSGYAQVIPEGDCLPCRVKWPGVSQPSLSVCPITADQPLWYALPDLAASVLLTGKLPRVLRAFRVRASGVQSKLRGISLGGTRLDPRDPAFFARVVEHRKRLQAAEENTLAAGVKALANSGCYGVFVEFNPQPIPERKWSEEEEDGKQKHGCFSVPAVIHSDRSFLHRFRRTVERPGPCANPYFSALVTAGGRLLLAMAEREAGSVTWLATDALAVVGGDVAAVQERFQRLSPYDPEVIPHFLKLEASGIAFALSSNRYCLRLPDGTYQKASQHGMSGILPPGGERIQDFAEQVWRTILTGEAPPEWERAPLRRRLPIRSPERWKQVREAIPGLRPFGFLLSATSPKEFPFNLDEGSGTYYGPYQRDVKASLKAKWLNTRTGKKVRLEVCPTGEARYYAPNPGEAYCSSVADFVDAFVCHKDAKMTGPDEALEPVPVQVSSVYHIGKETNRVEMTYEIGVVIGDRKRTGGAHPNSGGARPNSGGARPNSGGARPNSGGARPNSGGARPNSGGARPNSGGARPNSGGARPGAGRKKGSGYVVTPEQKEAIRLIEHYPPSRVAAAVGVTDRFLRQVFRGDRTPSPAVAIRICELSKSLPCEVPPSFRERCEAVRIAAERT